MLSGDKEKYKRASRDRIDEDSSEGEGENNEKRQRRIRKGRVLSEGSGNDSDRHREISKYTPRSHKSGAISNRTTIINIDSTALKANVAMDLPPQDSTSYQLPEFLRDPKYFRKGIEQTWEQDEAIVFPRIEEFAFDRSKYQEAIEFLRTQTVRDYRKKLSKEQFERLYPTNQPKVFKRLIADAADAVKRFDIKLREI